MPLRTRDLTAASLGAVRGQVVHIASAVEPERGAIVTYVVLDVAEVLFGPFTTGELTLRESGGRVGERQEWLFGNPEYRVGEHALVFLSANRDGTLRTTGLAMGKFTLTDRSDGPQAARDLGRGVRVLDASGQDAPRLAKDELPLATLRARIAQAAGRVVAPHGALQTRPDLTALRLEPRPAFILLSPFSRWFEPDDGQAIGFFVDPLGDATLGPEVSSDAVDAALAAWSAVPGTPLDLQRSGDTMPAPFAGCPDDNRIVFNDPFAELNEPRNCRGVLAVGGFCNTGETRVIHDTTFRRIITGKVSLNDGWGECVIWTPCNLAEIITHELGHGLGLGHSADTTATMAAMAHFDGRCASLADDDVAAIQFVYPIPPTPSATPTITPSPVPTGTVTRTGTITRTPSVTRTPSRTMTPTSTNRPTRTQTPSRTPVPTRTATAMATSTVSATATSSLTPTSSATATFTLTPTDSPSPSPTPSPPPPPPNWLALLIEALRRTLGALGGAPGA